MKIRFSTSGFTLIELLVGMTVFAIGLTGIFALLHSTMSTVSYSRDEIIVSGLLREQVDLVVNMRDTNLLNFIPWDSTQVDSILGLPLTQTGFASGAYMIENNFSSSGIVFDSLLNNGTISKTPVKLIKIDNLPISDQDKWNMTQLRMDDQGRYMHSTDNTLKTTQFASYTIVSPLAVTGQEVKKDAKNQGWIIDARVMVKGRGGIKEYDTKTMITDWQK